MIFYFRTEASYLEAYEYLLRILESFTYDQFNKTIEIDNPDDEIITRMKKICGECKSHDALLAKGMMEQDVAR